jgi:hypothetical protein
MLCSICQEIIQTQNAALLEENETTLCTHHSTGQSLQNAAKEECHICSLVWNRLAPSQQSYLLELNVDEPITIILMTNPQALGLPTTLFGLESLILCVQFEVGKDIWKLPGGARERTNMFVFQPSEGTE